ncbi:hypothetical protein ScPMuIL_015780 [Solemya velum]
MMDEIPFRHVSMETWTKLANKLDPEATVSKNNWRMLAEKLGYSTEQIMNFEAKQTSHGRNTFKVFEEYVNQSDSTVGKVQEALKQIDRPDALNILLEALPEIENKCKNEREQNKKKQNRLNEAGENHCSELGHGTSVSHPEYPCVHSCYYPNNHNHILPHCMRAQESSTPQNAHLNLMKSHPESPPINNMDTLVCRGSPPSQSMVVNIDPNRNYYDWVEDEPMDYNTHADSLLPLAEGLIRRQQQLPSISQYGKNVAVTTMSPQGRNIYKDENSSLLYTRQLSEEQNFNQASHDSKHTDKHLLHKLENRPKKDNFNSSSPTTPTIGNHIKKLEQLAPQFTPDEEFNKMIRDKKREEESKRNSGLKWCVNDIQNSNPHQHNKLMDHTNLKEQVEHGTMKDPSKTFPMRLRPSPDGHRPIDSSKQGTLTKSFSMPNDMKPAECHKAFRQIKVFVTYAADTPRHIQRVLNLCNCLEKNGFTCCMDIYHRRLQMSDRLGWFDAKFKEADFILVCVSSKYRMEVEQGDMEEDYSTENSLHTKYIYKLMHTEFVQKNSNNKRFVPLIFDNATRSDVPRWLQSLIVYKWPQDWKDLMWMLTKPEERIKPQSKSYFGKSNQINGRGEK